MRLTHILCNIASHDNTERERRPGPTSYEIKMMGKNEPSFSIGKGQRKDSILNKDALHFPGVGNYNITNAQNLHKDYPRYSFTKYKPSKKTKLSPGPADY
jgi:hypothetical protein